MSEVKFCLGQELKENIEIRRSLMGIKIHAKKSNPFKSLTLINQIKECLYVAKFGASHGSQIILVSIRM